MGQEREDSIPEGERTPTSTEAFITAGPQPMVGAVHSTHAIQVKGLSGSVAFPKQVTDDPGSDKKHLAPVLKPRQSP